MSLVPNVGKRVFRVSHFAVYLFTIAILLPLPGSGSDNGAVTEILENVEASRTNKNYRAAINRGLEGLPTIAEYGSPGQLTLLYGDIGSSFLDLGIVDSALWALKKAENLARKHKFEKALPIILNEQTEAYFYLPDLDKAQRSARQAIVYGKKVDDWEEVSRSMIALGNIHFRLRDLDSALAYYRQDVGIQNRHNGSSTTTLMNMGIVWDTRGTVDSALFYYLKALDQSRADSSKADEANVLQNMGTFYDDRGNYAEALNYYQQALTIFEVMQDQQAMIITSYNIASVLINQNQLSEGIKKLEEVEGKAKKMNLHDIENYCHIGLAGAYFRLGDYDNMLIDLQELESNLQAMPDKFVRTEYLLHMAEYHRAIGQLSQAIENAMAAKALAQETDQTSTFLKACRILAEYHKEAGNIPNAIKYALETYDKASISGFLNESYEASKILSDIYEEQGEYRLSLNYLQKAVALKDSLSEERAESETNRLLLLQLENEFKQLEYTRSLQESELVIRDARLAKQQWTMWLLVSLGLLFAILLGTVYYNRTRLKRINAQLRSQNRQIENQNANLAQLNKDKDRLMHVVAHDLRNPVNGIKGLAQLMDADPKLPEDQKQSVSHILRSSDHTLGIINELVAVDLSNPSEVEVSEVEITRLIQDTIQSHKPHANSKNISINYQNGAPLKVKTDADKVQRIVDNLLSNAIKFSEPGKAVSVKLTDQGKNFNIAIQDEGPGLTEEDRKSLFDKFKKLSAKPTAGESSTGLGLSIVSDFVKILKGEITVDSTLGQGTTFTVILPKHHPG